MILIRPSSLKQSSPFGSHKYALVFGQRDLILIFLVAFQLYTLIRIYNIMKNIEDLIKEIVSSPLFKNELHNQLKECFQQREEASKSSNNTVSLSEIVNEINGYITEITEIALQQENSKNYITFMKKSEELSNELEKQMNNRITASAEEMNLKIEATNLKLNQLIKNVKKGVFESSRLKDERKVITQSILETSRFQNAPKTQTTINGKSQISLLKGFSSSEQLFQGNQTTSSLEIDVDKSKIAQIEKQCKKWLQVWWNKVESALDILKKEHDRLKQSCRQLSEKAEMKLDGNLESLWNVISDLCSRISKFQSMQHIQT